MKIKRSTIQPRVRMQALIHSGHRCIYCGVTSLEEKLQVDHVIPVYEGGTDDIGNLVVACRACNIGKGRNLILETTDGDVGLYVKSPNVTRKKNSLAVPEKAREASRKCRDMVSAWLPQFKRWWAEIEVLPPAIDVNSLGFGFQFAPTLICRGRDGCDIGPEVRVLLTRWCEVGGMIPEEQALIRNAVISGYKVPTMIIMGPPSFFYAVVVKNRHKGSPEGFFVNHFLQPSGEWTNTGWCPDETLLFEDLRLPVEDECQEQLAEMYWDDSKGRFFGVYSSCDSWGL